MLVRLRASWLLSSDLVLRARKIPGELMGWSLKAEQARFQCLWRMATAEEATEKMHSLAGSLGGKKKTSELSSSLFLVGSLPFSWRGFASPHSADPLGKALTEAHPEACLSADPRSSQGSNWEKPTQSSSVHTAQWLSHYCAPASIFLQDSLLFWLQAISAQRIAKNFGSVDALWTMDMWAFEITTILTIGSCVFKAWLP